MTQIANLKYAIKNKQPINFDSDEILKEIAALEMKTQAFEEIAAMYINKDECHIPKNKIMDVIMAHITIIRNKGGFKY